MVVHVLDADGSSFSSPVGPQVEGRLAGWCDPCSRAGWGTGVEGACGPRFGSDRGPGNTRIRYDVASWAVCGELRGTAVS